MSHTAGPIDAPIDASIDVPINSYGDNGGGEPIGVIVAGGMLPVYLVRHLAGQGFVPFVIILDGQADHDYTAFAHKRFAAGQVAAITKAVREAGCQKLVLAGTFTRPSLRTLQLDKAGAMLLGRIALKGDDTILRLLKTHFASHDLQLLAVHDFLPHLIMPQSYHFGRALTGEEDLAARLAFRTLSNLGDLDIGQAVIVQQQRVLAIEAAEGTHEMIARTASYIDKTTEGAVFLKMPKAAQDRQLDMPVIGLQTIEALHKIGVKIILIEAEQTMLADPLPALETSLSASAMVMKTFMRADYET